MDLSPFIGPAAFGPAYAFMLEHDAHAPGSVDRELQRTMVRLCSETADELYSDFTELDMLYDRDTRPELESIVSERVALGGTEAVLLAIARFTRGLGEHAEQCLDRMLIGGTEEQIIQRGSDWCTDVARAACVLCQIGGFPCRVVNLFNLEEAYSGHVIVEVYRAGTWGAVDSSTGVIYHKPGGEPATVWDLMSDAELVEAHRGPDAHYTRSGQFRAAGVTNYFCWECDRYDYTVTGLNAYYFSILEMSSQGWPGGLRWLHGEAGGVRKPLGSERS